MAVTPHDLVMEAKAQIKEVTTADAQALIGKRVMLDVREPEEFSAGHLPGAINLPRGLLEFKIGMVPPLAAKDASILIYCATSGRAALSAVQLQRLGYTDVLSMAGGFQAWSGEGRATEKPAPVNFD